MVGDAAMPARAVTVPARHEWLDLARGIGIFLVVAGHMLRGLVSARIWPAGAVFGWIDYTLYTFHMPLFFYLSALNVRASLRRGPGAFLTDKGWNIVYPYVLWSLIQGGVIMAMGHGVNMPVTGADLADIWFRPIGQFWFLYALMICHVLAVFVPRCRTMAVVAVCGLVIFELLPDRPALALTLHDLPAYATGLCGGVAAVGGMRRPLAWVVTLPVAFAVAVCVGGAMSGMDAAGLASVPAEIFGILLVVFVSTSLRGRHFRLLAAMGRMSMTIYILHILAGAGTRIVLQRLHAPLDPVGYLAVCICAAVFLPMGLHGVLQRRGLLGPFGFGWSRTRDAG